MRDDIQHVIAREVDPDRVLQRLDALSKIGATVDGGVTRVAFSSEERQAQCLVAEWMREAGLTIAYDWFGNMFGSTDGNCPDSVVSMAGSHIDTVRNGGRFDGALGVIGAVESVMAMRAADRLPERPLEVVVWRCEEPVRFSQGKVGSLLFTGQVSSEQLQPIEDPPIDLATALAEDGTRLHRSSNRRIQSCLELHIEQGRRLEQAGVQIGVVTAVAAPIRLRIGIIGREDHSGATPMDERHDALCAAADLILAIEDAARREAKHSSVATTASVTCRPGVLNVIPGQATLLIDIRGIDLSSMQRVVDAVSDAVDRVGRARGVSIEIAELSRGTPTPFHHHVVECLLDTVSSLGYKVKTMPSGAGHDAQCLASMADVGMIFVPSVDGISHSPREQTRDDDVIAGIRSLAGCWWQGAEDWKTSCKEGTIEG